MDTVIVDGEALMMNRVVKTVDEQQVLNMDKEELEAAVGRGGMKKLFDTPERFWGYSKY